MRSKSSTPFSRWEKKHLERVKSVKCSVCGAPPPGLAHHAIQGDHFTTIALCEECHVGPGGIHGDRSRLRMFGFEPTPIEHAEMALLNITLRDIAFAYEQ